MFPFTDIVPANDQSVKELTALAWVLGGEGADWIIEWRDGGRVAFSFKLQEHHAAFGMARRLLRI
jgi:hypothetical protein